MPQHQMLSRQDRPSLAYHYHEGREDMAHLPALVFLPGYMSDMEGTKALALEQWAQKFGISMLRFDYSGCGLSEGVFEEQGLENWRDDVIDLLDSQIKGKAVLVGSSMGGWLMLLAALERKEKIAGLVGIASAPDFTNWGFSNEEKLVLLREGRFERVSPYGPDPVVTTRIFWESGEGLRLLHSPIDLHCPVRLIHGQADADVPWVYSLEIQKKILSPDVQSLFIKDGDHRLSRDQDIHTLLCTISSLMENFVSGPE